MFIFLMRSVRHIAINYIVSILKTPDQTPQTDAKIRHRKRQLVYAIILASLSVTELLAIPVIKPRQFVFPQLQIKGSIFSSSKEA